MQLDTQTRDTQRRSGRMRAAALGAAGGFRGAAPRPARSRRRAAAVRVMLGLVCVGLLAFVAAVPSASAVPSTNGLHLNSTEKSQVNSLNAQAKALQQEIATLDQQLEVSTEAYNQLAVQMDAINSKMMNLRNQLDMAQHDYQYRLRLYEDRLCDLYKAGGPDEFLQMLLDADSADDFVSRARLAAELADQDRRLMANLTRASQRLDDILAQEDTAKSQELVLRNQMDAEQALITATLSARQSTLANVDAQITAIIEAQKQRQAEEQERLHQALAAILNGGQVYNGTLPKTDNEIVSQFLQTAAAYIDIPYVWGGDRPSTGMDCSGYTAFVYKQHGVSLPHYSGYQAQMGLPVDLASIQPGDLLAFGSPVHHVGIYIGDDLFLHAPGTGLYIRVGRLSDRDDLAAIRRFTLKARSGAPLMN